MTIKTVTVISGSAGDIGPPGQPGPSYAATSATSFVIAVGPHVFATQAGLAYQIGTRARITSIAAPTDDYWEGIVTGYTGTALTVDIDLFSSTRDAFTHSDWLISLAGERGQAGINGIAGQTGISGRGVWNGTAVPTTGVAIGGGTVPDAIDGDFYIRTTTWEMYGPVVEEPVGIFTWGSAHSLIGSGSTWSTGSGAPSDGDGANNDYYLRTGTGEVYRKTGGAWGSSIATLIGPTGATGSTGATNLTIVRCVTTANVNLASGLANGQTVDGVTLATSDRVLVVAQTAAAQNGVYTVPASGAASRDTAFTTYDTMPGVVFAAMAGGTTRGVSLWVCGSARGGTINVTALAFEAIWLLVNTGTIASATTTELGSLWAQAVTISGAVTITSFGATARTGSIKFLEFSGAPLITHNGTSLILPGATNITAAAGDTAIVRHEGSGNWRCLNYQRAAGRPLNSGVSDTLTAGFKGTSVAAGTKSSGTFTPDPLLGNFQHATNGGAHTLAPPAGPCSMVVEYTNNASAGTITTSGFTLVKGDIPPTTNNYKYIGFVTVTQTYSLLVWQNLQL